MKKYIRNYIGFDTYIQMKEFIDINFRSKIKGIFPNYASIIYRIYQFRSYIRFNYFFNH